MPADDSFQTVPGGVTAASGFLAGTACCGIKSESSKRPDLALVCSEVPSVAAAVFTTNRIKAAPVKVSAAHLRARDIRAVVLNSGNANAATGLPASNMPNAWRARWAGTSGLRERQVLVCSTGRIGVPLPIERIEEGIARAATALASRQRQARRREGDHDLGHFPKEFAVKETLPDGRTFTVGGMAKGAGMINPNMATMLCLLSTDAPLEKKDLQRALGTSRWSRVSTASRSTAT